MLWAAHGNAGGLTCWRSPLPCLRPPIVPPPTALLGITATMDGMRRLVLPYRGPPCLSWPRVAASRPCPTTPAVMASNPCTQAPPVGSQGRSAATIRANYMACRQLRFVSELREYFAGRSGMAADGAAPWGAAMGTCAKDIDRSVYAVGSMGGVQHAIGLPPQGLTSAEALRYTAHFEAVSTTHWRHPS